MLPAAAALERHREYHEAKQAALRRVADQFGVSELECDLCSAQPAFRTGDDGFGQPLCKIHALELLWYEQAVELQEGAEV